jgi:predicted  nucleic acid-binding Zn-ribbon protein
LAVVSVWKEVCNGCHMNLPPQLYIELQKSFELHSCPNCNRIIYWYNQERHD